MYGAIEFMRAWRELCQESRCVTCKASGFCPTPYMGSPASPSDDDINKIISIAMATKALREKEENK